MGDTISRQAVIDAILPYCPDDDGTCSKSGDDLRNLLDDIENLPSAQQWIPVTERFPEKYIGQWLCCTSDGDIMVLPYDTPGDGTKECVFYQWDDDGYFYQTFDVVAWMPLPEPYNEELKLR